MFVDRWDRNKPMMISDLSRALILSPLLVVATGSHSFALDLRGGFRGGERIDVLLARQERDDPEPGRRAGLDGSQLPGSTLSEEIPSLIGPLLGGALLGVVGLSGLVLLDVGTYLASALLISMIGAPTAALDEEEPDFTAEVAVLGGMYRK